RTALQLHAVRSSKPRESAGLRLLEHFSLLLGIPEGVCSGVFIAENAHRYGSPHYTYRENAPSPALGATSIASRWVGDSSKARTVLLWMFMPPGCPHPRDPQRTCSLG